MNELGHIILKKTQFYGDARDFKRKQEHSQLRL